MQLRGIAIIALVAAAVLGGIHGYQRFSTKPAADAATQTIAQLPWTDIKQPLPMGEEWPAFAKPLVVGTHEMLLFQSVQGEGAAGRIWHIDWRSQQADTLLLNDVAPKNNLTYSALWSKAGLWLLGTRTQLIRPDGSRLSIEGDMTKGAAVALDDGSVLRLNDDKAVIEQLIPRRERIEVQPRGPLSFDGRSPTVDGKTHWAFNDQTLVKLKDDRILMLGGVNAPRQASIISPHSAPESWSITPAASAPHFHHLTATAVLPDGRVVVAGGSDCHGNTDDPSSVDAYDPIHDRWTALPSLPFLLCEKGPTSLAITPSGSLVASGHAMSNVMVLHHDPASANGFALNWTVYGTLPKARIGGTVQALSDDEVVVAGGGDSSGFDKVSITGLESNLSHVLDYDGAGAARRGALLFVGGGRRFEAGQLHYSAYAALINLRTGKAQRLPDIPFMSRAAQARWLDDDRILVKGRYLDKDGDGFTEDGNETRYDPQSSGSLSIFSIKANRWTTPAAGLELEKSELLDANDHQALLLSYDGVLQRLNLNTMETDDRTALPRKIQAGAIRLLPGNRIVIAGGNAPSDWISVVDDECEAARHAECPERYASIGDPMPSASYQWITFGNGEPRETMSKGATDEAPNSQSKVLATAITQEGIVYYLFADEEHNSLRFLRSDIRNGDLQSMPLPPGMDLSKRDYTLQLADDPRTSGRELLFLSDDSFNARLDHNQLTNEKTNVWLWNESQHGWQKVLTAALLSARSTPQPLSGLGDGPNGKILSMGWHLKTPILWTAQNQ